MKYLPALPHHVLPDSLLCSNHHKCRSCTSLSRACTANDEINIPQPRLTHSYLREIWAICEIACAWVRYHQAEFAEVQKLPQCQRAHCYCTGSKDMRDRLTITHKRHKPDKLLAKDSWLHIILTEHTRSCIAAWQWCTVRAMVGPHSKSKPDFNVLHQRQIIYWWVL